MTDNLKKAFEELAAKWLVQSDPVLKAAAYDIRKTLERCSEITVGCIVRRKTTGHEFSIEGLVGSSIWMFSKEGLMHCTGHISDFDFVSPSREAYGWPPIKGRN